MDAKDLLTDEILKQFKTGKQLDDFLMQVQKRGVEKMLEGELDQLDCHTMVLILL